MGQGVHLEILESKKKVELLHALQLPLTFKGNLIGH